MIQAKCGSCGKVYKLPDEAAGKKAKCKACGKAMSIPVPAAASAADSGPLSGARSGQGPSLEDLAALDDHNAPPMPGPDDASLSDPDFNPQVTFNYEPPKKPVSLPMPVILGVGGGALVLTVVGLVIALVIFSGDSQAEQAKAEAKKAGLSLKNLVIPDTPDTPDTPGPSDGEGDESAAPPATDTGGTEETDAGAPDADSGPSPLDPQAIEQPEATDPTDEAAGGGTRPTGPTPDDAGGETGPDPGDAPALDPQADPQADPGG